MAIAKMFRSRNCQAVQLPEEFRTSGKELDIFRRGDEIMLRERTRTMVRAFESLASLPNHLTIADRQNDRPQKRNGARLKKQGKG
jgi:antitoxin VapB